MTQFSESARLELNLRNLCDNLCHLVDSDDDCDAFSLAISSPGPSTDTLSSLSSSLSAFSVDVPFYSIAAAPPPKIYELCETKASAKFDFHQLTAVDEDERQFLSKVCNLSEEEQLKVYAARSRYILQLLPGDHGGDGGNGHTFYKKYPRRSEKSFKPVPDVAKNAALLDRDAIDIRALHLGPEFEPKNDKTMLGKKLKAALGHLSALANERYAVELRLFRSTDDAEFVYDRLKEAAEMHLEKQFAFVARCATDEAVPAQWMIKELKTRCAKAGLKMAVNEKTLLNDLGDSIKEMKGLKRLNVLSYQPCSTVPDPKEVKALNDALDRFIALVRRLTTLVWAMKTLLLMKNETIAA